MAARTPPFQPVYRTSEDRAVEAQAFALRHGADWAGDSTVLPPEPLDAGLSLNGAQEGRRSRCMKLLRDIRVMPVVLVAIFGLMVLKVAGLVLDGGYVFAEDAPPAGPAGPSWAQQNFNFPGAPKAVADSKIKADPGDITGSVEGKDAKKDEAPKPAAPAAEAPKPDGVVVNLDAPPPVSASERAILERLQSRRQELETRAREVEIRESLLKAAEKRIEAKVEEGG